MPQMVADLVLLKEGRPIIVVEAKGRPIPPAFHDAVREQIRFYAQRTESRWSVLVDPASMRVYKGSAVDAPVVEMPTIELLKAVGIGSEYRVGEQLLLTAVDRWLRTLADPSSTGKHDPRLYELADDMQSVDEVTAEFAIA